MRLLIYGMQSSGASTLAFLLGQKPDCAAFVDIWAMYAAPTMPDATVSGCDDVVAKVVVTTSFPLALHQERFRPDRTILMLRHPVVNHRSLAQKPYRHHCGFMEEKFPILDRLFHQGSGYDLIVHYEQMVFDPARVLHMVGGLGWPCDPGYLSLARGHQDMVDFNARHFPSVVERLQYGAGKHRSRQIEPRYAALDEVGETAEVADWCPHVLSHYESLARRGYEDWIGSGGER
jgi:hypothetical protein